MTHDEPDRTDADVLTASVADPSEFSHIYRRHGPVIHRYLARRLGTDVADDLTADTFTAAFGSRTRFDAAHAASARPWLFGIASNLAARHRRDEVRGLRALARTGIDPVAQTWVEQSDERLTAQALSRTLAAALAGLHARDRDVLLLTAWADLTYAEVAQALGLPIGTVRSRLHRARRRIRGALPADLSAQLPDRPGSTSGRPPRPLHTLDPTEATS